VPEPHRVKVDAGQHWDFEAMEVESIAVTSRILTVKDCTYL
jgi:hypothetical protein